MHYKIQFFVADQRVVHHPRIAQTNWHDHQRLAGCCRREHTTTREHRKLLTSNFKKIKLFKVPSCLLVNIITLHYSIIGCYSSHFRISLYSRLQHWKVSWNATTWQLNWLCQSTVIHSRLHSLSPQWSKGYGWGSVDSLKSYPFEWINIKTFLNW